MTTGAGLPGAPLKLSPPLLLNTLDDVLKHVSLVARTAVAVPSSIERSQLRPPSLITDAPLKLWLKQLDSETLEVLYNKSVVECTKAKLLGQRNEAAYRANRIREIAYRELKYRRAQPTFVQNAQAHRVLQPYARLNETKLLSRAGEGQAPQLAQCTSH